MHDFAHDHCYDYAAFLFVGYHDGVDDGDGDEERDHVPAPTDWTVMMSEERDAHAEGQWM